MPKRCRYCQRDITEKPGTALWIDSDGLWVCLQASDQRLMGHLPA